jgi:proteasome lid subunit RPN8/RPN11
MLRIPADIHDAMVGHCVRESPLECCGLLGGTASLVSSIHVLRNALSSATRYEADPNDVIKAVVALRKQPAEILAIYHSHPKWAAIPSRTDLERNYYGDVPRIIVSLAGPTPDVRVWRLDATSYEELPWEVVPLGVESRPNPN